MDTAIMSIRPKWVKAIFDGSKTFELRRSLFKSRSVKKIYVYETAPKSLIVGEFTVGEILNQDIATLWDSTKDGSSVQEKDFFNYFKLIDNGYAIGIVEPKLFVKSVPLFDFCGVKQAPQSFCYPKFEPILKEIENA